MLATLIIWIYIFILSFVYGVFCIKLLIRIFQIEDDHHIPLIISSIVGICFLTAVAGFLSLIMPIGLIANLVFITGAVVIVIFNHRRLISSIQEVNIMTGFRQKSRASVDSRPQTEKTTKSHPAIVSNQKITNLLIWLLFAALSLVVLSKTIQPPFNYDTGLYHAQAIRWIETYPAVPGLGNLCDRLAFNSAWFLPSALFNFPFLNLSSFHVLSGFFFLMVNGYFLGKLGLLLQGEYTLSNLTAPALIYFSRRLNGLELSSPGTDMPAALLIWRVFLLALEKIESGKSDKIDLKLVLIVLFSSSAVTIKLSAVPILILPVYFLVRAYMSRQKTKVALSGILILLVFVPWLARNVILSGYLIYPFAMIDLFNLDWKIPIAYVKDTANAITSWARLPHLDSQTVLQMTSAEWAPLWWKALQNFDRLLLVGTGIAIILLLVIVGARSLLDRKIVNGIKQYGILYLTTGFGLVYWFISAPNVRFGYGFLTILLCLLIAPIVLWCVTSLKWTSKPIIYAAIIGLLVYQAYGIYKLRDISQFNGRWVLPADYPTPLIVLRTLGGFDVNMPVNGDQCWYAPLPCTPTHNPEVHLRGEGLQDGFYNKSSRPLLPFHLDIRRLSGVGLVSPKPQ